MVKPCFVVFYMLEKWFFERLELIKQQIRHFIQYGLPTIRVQDLYIWMIQTTQDIIYHPIKTLDFGISWFYWSDLTIKCLLSNVLWRSIEDCYRSFSIGLSFGVSRFTANQKLSFFLIFKKILKLFHFIITIIDFQCWQTDNS